MDRAVHDTGGRPTTEPIDRTEHELEDWEVLTDALAAALASAGLMNVDEMRRGIESMPRAEYERASSRRACSHRASWRQGCEPRGRAARARGGAGAPRPSPHARLSQRPRRDG